MKYELSHPPVHVYDYLRLDYEVGGACGRIRRVEAPTKPRTEDPPARGDFAFLEVMYQDLRPAKPIIAELPRRLHGVAV